MRNDWYARQGLDHLAPNSIQKLSSRNAAAMIASGQLRSETLVRACLDRVSLRDSTVHAWSFLSPDSVLAQARARDSVAPVGPLHGIPTAVKDVIDVAGLPTGMGSPLYAGYHPFADAACVAALRAAGAVIMGKTVTAEFAGVAPGATTHPMALEHTPGGSSSGSAAAVADHMVPLALGTPRGGAVIRPAAYCGTVRFKPTFGTVSRAGVKQPLPVLDGRRIRIATFRGHWWSAAASESVTAVAEVAQALEACGCRLTEWKTPPGSTGAATFQEIWTLLGAPTITLPLRDGPGGLSCSVQLVGHPYGDAALLALSKWVVSDAEML